MQVYSGVAGIPASRQKNCNGCVQAKRRCDRRKPVCSRCAEKDIPCSYTKAKAVNRSALWDIRPSIFGCPASSSLPPGMAFDADFLGTMPMDAQPDASTPTGSTHGNFVPDTPGDGDISMDPFMNLIDGCSTPTRNQWIEPVDEGIITEHPNSLVDEEVTTAYQKMSSFCRNIEPWQLYDPQTRLHYAISRVKRFTTDVATRNATPFLHRYLYRNHRPQCMLSCFTTNVLYANRTDTNMAMVMRALQESVHELIVSESNRVVATPTEKLARAQALFLYQVIRLFDGDITLRAQGEKDTALLHTWLGDLCRIREHLGDLAELENGATRSQPPKEWERWVFAESVRRTIVMAHSVMKVYEMMKGSDTKGDPGVWAYNHRWTLSRHLWEADSTYEFERMWKEKPQFIISNFSFARFLEHGRGEDVDEFAEILLSMYMGVNETKEFISAGGVK